MNKFKKYLPYLIVFTFFLIITTLSPIVGDDWNNYLIGKKGIYKSFTNAVLYYNTWEGRFIGRILINILTYNKIIWNIINSFVVTSIIYLIINIMKPKNKKTTFLLLFILFLGINPETFAQTIMWIAGSITYLFVIPLFLLYMKLILSEKYKEKNIIITLFLSILNIIIPMFIEHIGVLFVIFNLFILITNYIKNKKIDKILLLYLFISTLSIISMLISPGQLNRIKIDHSTYSTLNIFQKINHNIPVFLEFTYLYNPLTIITTSIANIILINKIKTKKIPLLIYITIIPLILELLYIFNTINLSNFFIILYFISYTIINIILIKKIYNNKNKNYILLFITLGFLANIIMLISPVWGPRTAFATYLFITSAYIMIIDNYIKENNTIKAILIEIICILIPIYIILYINIYKYEISLNKSIKKQLKDNNQTIEIKKVPKFIKTYVNLNTEYHINLLKKYYKIPKDKTLKIK